MSYPPSLLFLSLIPLSRSNFLKGHFHHTFLHLWQLPRLVLHILPLLSYFVLAIFFPTVSPYFTEWFVGSQECFVLTHLPAFAFSFPFG